MASKKKNYACRDMSKKRHVALLRRHGKQPGQDCRLHSAAEEIVVLDTLIES